MLEPPWSWMARLKRWRTPAAGAPFLLELLEILAAIEELERARRRERARRII
jgi:hypothetical protein